MQRKFRDEFTTPDYLAGMRHAACQVDGFLDLADIEQMLMPLHLLMTEHPGTNCWWDD